MAKMWLALSLGHNKHSVEQRYHSTVIIIIITELDTGLVSLGCHHRDHKLGDFNNRNVFLTVLPYKSEIWVLELPGSGEGPRSSLHVTTFWLCPHTAEREGEREREHGSSLMSLLIRVLIPKWELQPCNFT